MNCKGTPQELLPRPNNIKTFIFLCHAHEQYTLIYICTQKYIFTIALHQPQRDLWAGLGRLNDLAYFHAIYMIILAHIRIYLFMWVLYFPLVQTKI